MRIEYKTLKKLKKEFGSYEIIPNDHGLSLRFGYWQQVDVKKLEQLLPGQIHVEEFWDHDEDCGYLYSYDLEYYWRAGIKTD